MKTLPPKPVCSWRRLFLQSCLLLACLTSVAGSARGEEETWKAGVAKAIITPTVCDAIEDFLEHNPNHASFIELNPLFKAGRAIG